jgi:serpin B
MNTLTPSILHSLFTEYHNQNWVFSPASYLEAMRNLSFCLRGQNLAELVATAPDIERPQSLGLDTYNCLLVSSEYHEALNEAVVAALASLGTDLKNFEGPEVVGIVNALVREKTHGKIDGLIGPNDITEFTKFIILNCVYFKKKWLCPFEERYYTEPFYGAELTVETKFLHHKIDGGLEKYYEDSVVDIAELNYQGSNVACYLIVPKTSLFEVFNDLSANLEKIRLVKSGLDLDVTVPAFKTECTFDLRSATQTAGVKNIWSWSKDWTLVDWSKLKDEAVMKVELIRQKTFLDFTKDGTEAAAATVMTLGITGCAYFKEPNPIKYIRADKPFVYVLANKNDLSKPLFVGVVNDVQACDGPSSPKPIYISGGRNLSGDANL